MTVTSLPDREAERAGACRLGALRRDRDPGRRPRVRTRRHGPGWGDSPSARLARACRLGADSGTCLQPGWRWRPWSLCAGGFAQTSHLGRELRRHALCSYEDPMLIPKVLVVYYSRTRRTERAANAICNSLEI